MPSLRNEIRFLLNDREVRLSQVGSADTLLDHIRLDQHLRGTKEGCAEGDCGACTVLVGRLHDGSLIYETVNACIRLLASVDNCHVVTVENLRGENGDLHPVQQAWIEEDVAQCGYCQAGQIMEAAALLGRNPDPSNADIAREVTAICRCGTYQRIRKAIHHAARLMREQEQ